MAINRITTTDQALKEGDSIVVDMGAAVGGYRSDLTYAHLGAERTRSSPSANLVWQAQRNAIDNTRLGLKWRRCG
ncbi:MAG: M24 family metallopeptidase [Ardenticatenales bacterium]|nr:M24 family metallopeptidase [Ardenticatenales bacterium]